MSVETKKDERTVLSIWANILGKRYREPLEDTLDDSLP